MRKASCYYYYVVATTAAATTTTTTIRPPMKTHIRTPQGIFAGLFDAGVRCGGAPLASSERLRSG